jgi:hypothetical protein
LSNHWPNLHEHFPTPFWRFVQKRDRQDSLPGIQDCEKGLKKRRHMLRLINDTAKLDLCKLNPNACHQPLKDNYELLLNKTGKRRFRWFAKTREVFSFFANAIRLSALWVTPAPPNIKDKVAFFAFTANQQASLLPVAASINEKDDRKAIVFDMKHMRFLKRFGLSYWLAAPFLPALIGQYFRSSGYNRLSFNTELANHWHTYGLYFLLRRWFSRQRPAAVVVSNDHIHLPCTIVQAAKDAGIPAYYIQHACITDRFPPLQVDFALLDGEDAKQKYLAAGESDAKIDLVGVTKMDGYENHINTKTTVDTIGLCFSVADELDRILMVLEAVKAIDIKRVIVRPHMRMNKPDLERLTAETIKAGFELSVHGEQSPIDYLKSIDLLICGVSAIALEAALMNITVVNFVTNTSEKDWYGFIQNGLLESFEDKDKLIAFINTHQQHRQGNHHAAKRYCDTVGTKFEGRSSELAASKILQRINDVQK